MHIFLNPILGAIVWTFANVLYVDLRRKGRQRGRFLAFFAGYPGTLVSLFLVPEGTDPQLRPPPDDEERLLQEVRRDRALRADRGGGVVDSGALTEPPPSN